jgi:hypothetical protein
MSAREDVIALAEAEARESKIFFWSGGPGAVFVNALRRRGDPEMDLTDCGKTADAPISCADYPLLLARLTGHLQKDAIVKIFNSYQDSKYKNKQSGTYSWYGFNLGVSDITVKQNPSPRRGDLIFLSTGGGLNDCEHVMLACGNGESAISFGNKHLDQSGATRRSVVNKTTITAMKNLYQAHFIKTCSPVWCGALG